jgi:hypothetical protein
MKNNLRLKRTYWKHLGHFLLQETEINLSSTDTRRIPKRTLEMKLRGRRPRGRPRTRWMDQVMRDVEKRGKKWTQVKQDREWEARDRWRFLCNSRPKKLETT